MTSERFQTFWERFEDSYPIEAKIVSVAGGLVLVGGLGFLALSITAILNYLVNG